MNAIEQSSNPNDVVQLLHDRGFRRRVRQLDPDALASLGYQSELNPAGIDGFKVVTSTRDTMYVQMPAAPDNAAGDIALDDLQQIQAAGSAGSASSVGSAGTASTLGTVCSTASSSTSASSLGSAGSAGSAG